MNRVTLRKISPTLKLALLLTAFALLNLAPRKEDCCRNEEEGDDELQLFHVCAVGDPEVQDLTLDAGASYTLSYKQTDCGDANSTFLVPRNWSVRPGPGITITSQSVSGSRISITFRVTEHPEVYDSFKAYDQTGQLTTTMFVDPMPSGMAELLQGELRLHSASTILKIKQQAGTDVPWSRSDARNAPAGPRIQVTPPIPFFQPPNQESKWWFTISNRGKANLDIYSITLEEQGDKWFRFNPTNAVPPYYLAPGKAYDQWIICKPLSVGTKGATIVITSNDPTFSVVRTIVKATAYASEGAGQTTKTQVP